MIDPGSLGNNQKEDYKFKFKFIFEGNEFLLKTMEVQKRIREIGEQAKKTSDQMKNLFTAVGGMGIIHQFAAMSTEITEIDNRLHVLNKTVLNTGLSFRELVHAASRSRASLKDFSEFFMRIGMSSAEYFREQPQNLVKMAETLSKQFQLMHLNPQQLMSVQTAILDAMELGYFDWRHLRAGIQHDNPLFRGYLKYMGYTGEQGQQAARAHKLTAQSFTNYVVSRSSSITQGFDESQITLRQFGYILQNDVLSNLKSLSDSAMLVANGFYHVYRVATSITAPVQGLGTSIVGHTGAGLMIANILSKVGSAAKKGIPLAWNFLKGTNPWLLAGGAAVGIGAWAYGRYKEHQQEGEFTESRSGFISSIANDVHDISQQMGLTRETLNDLVSRTESLLLRSTLQNGMGIDGSMGGRHFSELLAKEIKADLDKSGIGY